LSLKLAQRLKRVRPSPTVGITALATRLREAGRDIVVLSVGEPDFPTPEHVKAAARDALARNDTKYTAVDGARLVKEAVVAKAQARERSRLPDGAGADLEWREAVLLQRVSRPARFRRRGDHPRARTGSRIRTWSSWRTPRR
jgi:hypothetical protein